MKQKIKIIIAEDKELFRKALIFFIEGNKKYQIIDEASNGKELIDKLSNNIPDLILLDYKMPEMDGKEALVIIKNKYPEVKILMLSLYDEAELIIDLLSHGANGFVSKSESPEVFFTAIETVITTGRYFDPRISEVLLNGLLKKGEKNHSGKMSLSEREISVLKEICNGHTNKLISEKLFISTSTVDFHKGNIYKKTYAKNVVDLVKYAIKNGITPVN